MRILISLLSAIRHSICQKGFFLILLCVFHVSVEVLDAQELVSKEVAKKSVVGIVRDAHTKLPIQAAQITVLNQNVSSTTNENGVFKLNYTSGSDIIVVSAYDYNLRQLAVRSSDSIVIDLYPQVLSSYYKTVEGLSGKKENIFSVSAVKGITDLSLSNAISPDELLQSKFGADVRAISRSGVAAMGASVFIRGFNSLNANSQPLYIVDGVIFDNLYGVESIYGGFYSNPLANIDANDIESISVIKDGTSIYGSKASNGIIMIKTKRGSSMVTKINVNVLSGMTTSPKTIPLMNAGEFRTYASDLIGTVGLTNDQIEKFSFLNNDPTSSTYNTYHNNTNWLNEIYQTGMVKSYSINANGGDDKALYYFSLGYTGVDGVVKSTDMSRVNARFNADINLSKFLTFGLNISFSNIDRSIVDDGVNYFTSPTWLSMIKAPFLSPYNFTSIGSSTSELAYTDEMGVGNPKAIVEKYSNTFRQHSFNIGANPVYHFNRHLKLSTQFDYSLNKTVEDYYSPMFYVAPRMIDRIGYAYNSRKNQVMRNILIYDDTKLSYSKLFDKIHQVDAVLGFRYINNYYESDYIEGHNSGSNSSTNLPGGFKSDYFKINGINNWVKSLSTYLSVDYRFDNRFFVSLASSLDGSSRFGNETKGGVSLFGNSFGVFPSINGAWLMSSEKFMRNVDLINLMKIRIGYGVTGNDNIEDYATHTYFRTVRQTENANGIVLSNIANTQIQWETTYRKNIGVDLNVFNERVNMSFDYYSAITKNLLSLKTQPYVTGLNYYWSNDGEMSNAGFEFSLGVKVLNTKSLKWELGFSAGKYKNEILSLPLINGTTDYTTQVYGGQVLTAIGQPAGVFYGYKTNGVFSTEAEAANENLKILNSNGTYQTFKAGDVWFVDGDKKGNKDGIIDENDKQIIGNPNPDLYGNFSSMLSYKRLVLSALFTYSYGNDVYNFQRSQLESGSSISNQTTALLNRWTAEGQRTAQPKAVNADPMGNARFSDRWIEDGSYLRLKTLTLSYNIPFKSKYIEGLSVWVSANNLLTVTNYLGADPEFSSNNSVLFQGVDAGLVPLSKSFYCGLKFNL